MDSIVRALSARGRCLLGSVDTVSVCWMYTLDSKSLRAVSHRARILSAVRGGRPWLEREGFGRARRFLGTKRGREEEQAPWGVSAGLPVSFPDRSGPADRRTHRAQGKPLLT